MTEQNKPYPSTIETIGDTPLVELSRLTRGMDGRILAKMEYLNPGFSKKDRIARQIIEDAEAEGLLQPGQTVVELTSGNTGTGLSIVCGVKGYHFVAVMSRGNSMERARMMSALGAEVVLVDQLPGSQPGQVSGGDLALVEQVAQRIVLERNAFRADQFHLAGNFRAHYLHTGPEILRQSGGAIDAFCDFAGTGGSFAGCAAAFKEYQPGHPMFFDRAGRRGRVNRASRSSIPTTASRVGAMRWPTCRNCAPSTSTATCKSPIAKRSRSPAAWRVRKASSPVFLPEPMSLLPCICWRLLSRARQLQYYCVILD